MVGGLRLMDSFAGLGHSFWLFPGGLWRLRAKLFLRVIAARIARLSIADWYAIIGAAGACQYAQPGEGAIADALKGFVGFCRLNAYLSPRGCPRRLDVLRMYNTAC